MNGDLPEPEPNPTPDQDHRMIATHEVWRVRHMDAQGDDGGDYEETDAYLAEDIDTAFRAAEAHMRLHASQFTHTSLGDRIAMVFKKPDDGKMVQIRRRRVYSDDS